jgi:hypothetical protein
MVENTYGKLIVLGTDRKDFVQRVPDASATRQLDQNKGRRNMAKSEVIENVSKIPGQAEELGIAISGEFASTATKGDSDGDFVVTVNCEIQSIPNHKMSHDFKVVAICYDHSGRVVGTDDQWIDAKKFAGFDVANITIYAKAIPSSVKLVVMKR